MIVRNVTCKTTPVSRLSKSGGRISAVAGAAYRAGENIKARGQGPDGSDRWFRYSNRSAIVRETFIMLPEGAPDYAADRAELWNRVDEMETHKKARLAREVQLGFAYEVPKDEQRALLKEFVQREFVDRGFVADVAIHDYGRTLPAMGGSETQQTRLREFAQAGIPFLEHEDAIVSEDAHVLILRNRQGETTGYKLYQPHAHVRVTPRTVADGDWSTDKYASRELNRHDVAMAWRYEWPKLQNGYLERIGSDVRVSSTSAEEDAFPLVPREAEGGNEAIHAIDERAHELEGEALEKHEAAKERQAIDQEFRQVHNEAMRQAYRDEHTETSDEEVEERDGMRLAAWWRNMSQRYNEWRFEFRDQASEWAERFRQQKWRMKSLLGWHHAEPESEPPPAMEPIDGPEPDRDEPEQER